VVAKAGHCLRLSCGSPELKTRDGLKAAAAEITLAVELKAALELTRMEPALPQRSVHFLSPIVYVLHPPLVGSQSYLDISLIL
jgi:hypothetical protein